MSQSTPHTDVVIYSASYCPYCDKAKKLFDKKNVTYDVVDVTDPSTREDMIKKSNGKRTVPQIFIGGVHVGGYSDAKALDDKGELDVMLQGTSATPSTD